MKFLLYIIPFFCVLSLEAQRNFTVMTYNCENAFNTVHDEGKEDADFLPGGKYWWTNKRMMRKLRNIGKVVMAVSEVRPADVVCLCEVENDSVMERLTRRTKLASVGYQYVITDSPDARGVDVALMYSPYTFRLVEWRSVRAPFGIRTRDILHVVGRIASGDTLDIYAVHLPSKLGGAQSHWASMRVAEKLKVDIDSVMGSRQSPNIVVMGDFNASAGSSVFRKVLKVKNPEEEHVFDKDALYIMSGNISPGTYKYHGVWTTLDHILLSGSFFALDNGVRAASTSAKVGNFPFLLEEDNTYHGVKPKRTYVGYKYNDGFSDHLPLWMDLLVR